MAAHEVLPHLRGGLRPVDAALIVAREHAGGNERVSRARPDHLPRHVPPADVHPGRCVSPLTLSRHAVASTDEVRAPKFMPPFSSVFDASGPLLSAVGD